jgi:hypothetical protein
MRAIGWYLLLVGFPAAALIGILKIGETLEPPRAVHGTYAVAYDTTASGHCLMAVIPDDDKHLKISQSGPRLELSLGSLELSGAISADTVRAAAAVAGNDLFRAANCLTTDTLRIAAALIKTAGDTRLAGNFTFSGCESCTAVPFTATRQPDRESGR